MFKNISRTWIVALVLGWLFDFLFWKRAPGVNFAIFAILCLAGGFFILTLEGIKPTKRTLLLVFPILFFLVVSFTRQEPLTQGMSYLLSLIYLGLLVSTYTGGRWTSFGLVDYLVSALHLAGGAVAKSFVFLTTSRQKPIAPDGQEPSKRKSAWPVIRGILFALPILVIFTALLSSADMIFAQKIDSFVALFKLEKLPEYLIRLFIILVGAFLLAGVFLQAAFSSKNEKLIGEDKPLVAQFMGFTEATIILGSVGLLFALFVVVQFQYFFGGQANIQIDGYTFSEYARKGFGELILVAFFSLLLFLGLSGITQRDSATQKRVFSGLGIGMVVLVGVMLVSAFKRLVLYETAYGFSRLRTYSHVFMWWLALLLVVVIVLEILHAERRFALAAFLSLLGFCMSLAIMNVDGFIVKQNVQRAIQGYELDVPYLVSLSTDAIPDLSRAFADDSIPARVHELIGAALSCNFIYSNNSRDSDWRAFNYSQRQGQKLLENLRIKLKKYPLVEGDGTPAVSRPSGEIVPCYDWQGFMD